MERNVYFPTFSSFPIFFITLFTAIFLFIYVLNDSGILCIILMLYLLLLSVQNIVNAESLVFITVCGVCICEVRVLYAVLPHIFVKLSNGLVFLLCHIFLIHNGMFIFAEFGLDKVKQQPQMRAQMAEIGLLLLITFPSLIAAVWSYAASLFIELAVVPFVAVLATFVCYQAAFVLWGPLMLHNPSRNFQREEIPLAIGLVQLLAGSVPHLFITVDALFHTGCQWPSVVADQALLWTLGSFLASLLPPCRTLLKPDMARTFSAVCGSLCALLTVPTLLSHGIRLHTARPTLILGLLLSAGLVLASRRTRKPLWLLPLIVPILLLALLLLELPWGLQLLPGTFLLLERLYISIALIAAAALLCLRGLDSRRSPLLFQTSFVILVSVFHVSEASLYFVTLVPSLSFLVTIVLVAVTQSCLYSRNLGATSSAIIDSQLVVKVLILAVHWSLDGVRVHLTAVSMVGTLLLGFVCSLSMRTGEDLFTPLLRPVLIWLGLLLLLPDSSLLLLIHTVTRQQLLPQFGPLHCLVIAAILEVLLGCRKGLLCRATSVRTVLASAVLTAVLVDVVAAVGLLLLEGCVLEWRGGHDKWDLRLECRSAAVLSLGCVLILWKGLPGTEVAVVAISAASLLGLHRVVLQSSSRVFKRLFWRLWASWTVCWLLGLLLIHEGHLRVLVVVLVPGALSWSLAGQRQSLEDSGAESMTSRVRLLSLGQAFVGGLLLSGLNFSSPQVCLLPFLLLRLERPPCSCALLALRHKHIDPLSLSVSLCGLFLLLGTLQDSALLSPPVPASAATLSLQLDLVHTIKLWLELLLTLLIGLGHLGMFLLSLVAIRRHSCTSAAPPAHLDLLVTLYTLIVPLSLGFLFCSTCPSSAGLALLSFTIGLRFLIF